MDRKPSQNLNQSGRNNNTRRSRSTSNPNTSRVQRQQPHINVQDATLLAQFATAAGNNDLSHLYSNMLSQNSLPHNPYPSMNPTPGFYGNFLHHNAMSAVPPQLPPLSSLDFPWPTLPTHNAQAGPSHHHLHQAPSTSGAQSLPYLNANFPVEPQAEGSGEGGGRRGGRTNSTSSQGHTTTSPELDQTDAERHTIAEEKRRRNTAASARFRIKKKHKTLNLERSVSDLTGRAEELEREAADLRRENGWLKEIVMLKGTRFAASNLAHREALTQAAALAIGGGPFAHGQSEPSGSRQTSGRAQNLEDGAFASESSDSESEDDETDTRKKVKKSDSKSKKK